MALGCITFFSVVDNLLASDAFLEPVPREGFNQQNTAMAALQFPTLFQPSL